MREETASSNNDMFQPLECNLSNWWNYRFYMLLCSDARDAAPCNRNSSCWDAHCTHTCSWLLMDHAFFACFQHKPLNVNGTHSQRTPKNMWVADLARCTAQFDVVWLLDGLCFEATVGAHERGKQHNDRKQAAIPGYEEHDRAWRGCTLGFSPFLGQMHLYRRWKPSTLREREHSLISQQVTTLHITFRSCITPTQGNEFVLLGSFLKIACLSHNPQVLRPEYPY